MLGLAAVLILHCRPTGSNPFHPSRRPLAAILPLFLRRVQLPMPLGLNLLLVPGEHVLWSDVADGTVQANVVVMLHITLYQAPCIFQRQRRSRPNALAFQRLVPALNLAVGVSCQLRHNVTLKDNDSVSFIPIIPGTDANLNC